MVRDAYLRVAIAHAISTLRDHVPPPDDQAERVAASLARQQSAPVPQEEHPKYNDNPAHLWDLFYQKNQESFFKDRKWLHLEFPELIVATKPESGPQTIIEIGCGAGNAAFPILTLNENPELVLHACDYSTKAIEVVKANPLYSNPPLGQIHASVWDLSSTNSLPENVAPGSVDIVVMIFVLSALHPNEWAAAINNVHEMLKPGGLVILRDYGRYDLTQLRFKSGRLLSDNFYIRGDGTRVYFFEQDELSLLFRGSRMTADSHSYENNTDASDTLSHPPPRFNAEQLGVDRRMLVNRKKQLKMYRVWMQGKFRKQQ